MKKLVLLIILFWLSINLINCYQVLVGAGNDTSQHLPCDPHYKHSGSQLIYKSDYFPYSGVITELSFEYQFVSANPATFLNNITVMMGESEIDSYQDGYSFIPLEQLELCFAGNLTGANFQATNTSGAGRLYITLQEPFSYSKTGSLILFFMENDSDNGSNGDNFKSFSTSLNTSMCFIGLENPLDLDNLVAPSYLRNILPNTIFEFTINENCPLLLAPANSANNVAVTTPLQVKTLGVTNLALTLYSNTNVHYLNIADNFEQISENIYNIYPQLPLKPATYYEWQATYTHSNVDYVSEIFSFTTNNTVGSIVLSTEATNSYAVNLLWNILYANQYPYHIYRNGQIISTQPDNSLIDTQVSLGETYEYQVKLCYIDGSFMESNICSVALTALENNIINEQFEDYPSFQTNFGEWQNTDNDGNSTYSLPTYEYPNQGAASGFVIFEPGAVTPPLNLNISGSKCLVSFASSIPPTSDLITSPPFQASQVEVDIYLKSYNTAWGQERIKCGLLLNNDPNDMVDLVSGGFVEIPAEMTHLHFAYETDRVEDDITNFWLESCGIQTLMLIVDRIVISTNTTANEDFTQVLDPLMIFPNPVRNRSFTLINQRDDSQVRVYNLKGQLIHKTKTDSKSQRITLPKGISSGIYLLKVKSAEGEIVKKISVM